MIDPATPRVRRLAQRLLAQEAAWDRASEANGFAAVLACEKLRRPLTSLAGSAGFSSLLSRALTLARKQAPILSHLQLDAKGRLMGSDDWHREDIQSRAQGSELVLAEFLGLLIVFVGERLTVRLVYEVWPDASLDFDTEGKDNA